MVSHEFCDVDGDGNCWYRCLVRCFINNQNIWSKIQTETNSTEPHETLRLFVADLLCSSDGRRMLHSTLELLKCAPFVEPEIPFVENFVTSVVKQPGKLDTMSTGSDVIKELAASMGTSATYSSQVETDLFEIFLKKHHISLITLNVSSWKHLHEWTVTETMLHALLTSEEATFESECIVLVRLDDIAHYVVLSLDCSHIIEVDTLKIYLEKYLKDDSLVTRPGSADVTSDEEDDVDTDLVKQQSIELPTVEELQFRREVIERLEALCANKPLPTLECLE